MTRVGRGVSKTVSYRDAVCERPLSQAHNKMIWGQISLSTEKILQFYRVCYKKSQKYPLHKIFGNTVTLRYLTNRGVRSFFLDIFLPCSRICSVYVDSRAYYSVRFKSVSSKAFNGEFNTLGYFLVYDPGFA